MKEKQMNREKVCGFCCFENGRWDKMTTISRRKWRLADKKARNKGKKGDLLGKFDKKHLVRIIFRQNKADIFSHLFYEL